MDRVTGVTKDSTTSSIASGDVSNGSVLGAGARDAAAVINAAIVASGGKVGTTSSNGNGGEAKRAGASTPSSESMGKGGQDELRFVTPGVSGRSPVSGDGSHYIDSNDILGKL
jgi:hypothetical protein